MNHRNILTRAWTILWHSRALWLFGLLFVLAGGGGGLPSLSSSSRGGQGNARSGDWPEQFPSVNPNTVDWTTVWLIVAGVVVILLGLTVALLLTRYMAETALMAGADEIERTGAALSVRRGFRLGWSRQAWRLFLIDALVYLPLTLGGLALMAVAALPLLLWLTKLMPLAILATLFTAGLELLLIFALIALTLGLSMIMPFARRRVVLDGQEARTAFRQGLKLVRRSLSDTGLLWLLLTAIRIVWSLVMYPVVILLLLLAGVIGGVPAGITYLVSQSWVWAVVVGAPLFLVVLIPSASLVGGLFEAYTSTAWTLAYREVSAKFADPPVTPAR